MLGDACNVYLREGTVKSRAHSTSEEKQQFSAFIQISKHRDPMTMKQGRTLEMQIKAIANVLIKQ